jgi:16S rRNA (guanine527-N7)-methyltransferase
MTYDLTEFQTSAASLGITLSKEQLSQFLSYYQMLIAWNEKMNLTAVTDFKEVLEKHFLDSLSLVQAVDLPAETSKKEIRLIDVGTGAGFPGIPLKIAFPGLSVVLLDSLNKRIRFLNAVIEELGLTDITAIHGRSEELARNKTYRESFGLCVSRAVANLSTLSEYCLPFVRPGGLFLSYKGSEVDDEAEAAEHAIHILGGKIQEIKRFSLPDTSYGRSLVVIRKKKQTPGKYPRKAGTPSKEPLQ